MKSLIQAQTKAENAARLDIAADRFWGDHHERAFLGVCIFNPLARSNNQPIQACYRKHENQKKRDYEQRVCEIEHGSLTPLVLSASGGLESAASVFYKRLASKLAEKTEPPYSTTLAWLRSTVSFSLPRSAIQSIRGTRSTGGRPLRDSAVTKSSPVLSWSLWKPDSRTQTKPILPALYRALVCYLLEL